MVRFLFMHKLCISICFHQFCFHDLYLYLTYLSFVFMNLVTRKQVFKREGGGSVGNTWQTGMKPRKFENVPTIFSFEFSCFKNCLECYIYTSLLPQLRLYFRLFWPTWRKRYVQCCYLSVTGWQRAKVFSWRQPGRSAKTINLLVFA